MRASIFKSMYKRMPAEYGENEEFCPLQLEYVLNLNPSDTETFTKDILFVSPLGTGPCERRLT